MMSRGDRVEEGRISRAELEAITREGLPLAAFFGFRVEALGRGTATVRLPAGENLLRPGGTISGPAMMAVADYAMYAAVLGAIGPVAGVVTSNLSINFLERPAPVDLLASARTLRVGRRLAYGEVLIRPEGGAEPVAHVTATFVIPAQSR